MEDKKETRGIYNTTFNEKKATPISVQSDLEKIEDAIIEEVVMYVKGYHNIKRDKGLGAEHIKIHLEQNSQGAITLKELLDLGKSIRAYIDKFQEPFIDKDNRKIYEWENEKGVRFRTIIDKIRGEGLHIAPLSPSNEVIITFYSDRNLNAKMRFKNPKVAKHSKMNHEENPTVGSPYPTFLSDESAKTALGDESLSSGNQHKDIVSKDNEQDKAKHYEINKPLNNEITPNRSRKR
ncbi:hypothetical protein [Helicobacter cappadocius]|uniref:Uncharacterized protein n=1 Tax=Helicobacter cappadocius TaxID=3063998 RepID=A0AA90PU66_9HELI|nr:MULTISPECIES: hypothetical protein [unclassified Helicobacter]MDO7253079.1 hypothetical protein [Helicobacter sp. faydin-H75]MDP2538795.1 hypothetical protein [Helicobacter sp. faydin-H76]